MIMNPEMVIYISAVCIVWEKDSVSLKINITIWDYCTKVYIMPVGWLCLLICLPDHELQQLLIIILGSLYN